LLAFKIQIIFLMKKILIIYPHFPPSNLAGVHRVRLFAQHLPKFGWDPIVLTVHEKYYEENLDYNLQKLLSPFLKVEKVSAFKITKPRLVGDIGLRAFFQLYRKAKEIIRTEHPDFVYIPIPSFYCALLGRWLHRSTKVKYGIDYIDPWVHDFPGSDIVFSRHWFSTQAAKFLEPIAIKKATLITGVAEGYYEEVIRRNPQLLSQTIFGAMPYGGEKTDHEMVTDNNIQPYLFFPKAKKKQIVYAGAMLPKAYDVLERIFREIQLQNSLFNDVEFHFIGTGKSVRDPSSFTIKPMAEKYFLWQTIVFEYPQRIPYLDVIAHLNIADAVFILGSTEPHYTPSKVYQAILAEKPLFAVLHQESSAAAIIREANAGIVLMFNGIKDIDRISSAFIGVWQQFIQFQQTFNPGTVNLNSFNKYSADSITNQLAQMLNKASEKK
jgi:hypothetical protein